MYFIVLYRTELYFSGPRAAILHRASLLTELFCSLDTVLREKDKEEDIAARKAAQVTYISAYRSFLSRTLLVIYNYIKIVMMESTGNILYIRSEERRVGKECSS